MPIVYYALLVMPVAFEQVDYERVGSSQWERLWPGVAGSMGWFHMRCPTRWKRLETKGRASVTKCAVLKITFWTDSHFVCGN